MKESGKWINVKADLESLDAELGAEALDGLYSIYEEGEDVSCMTLKRILGKRDKKYGAGNLFER